MDRTLFKAYREELGLSQGQLADVLGLGPSGRRTVNRWENGPSAETVAKAQASGKQVIGYDIPLACEIAIIALTGRRVGRYLNRPGDNKGAAT